MMLPKITKITLGLVLPFALGLFLVTLTASQAANVTLSGEAGKDDKPGEKQAGTWKEKWSLARAEGAFAFSADGELLAVLERNGFDGNGRPIGTFTSNIGFYEVKTKKRIAEQKASGGAMTFALKGQAFAATGGGGLRSTGPGGLRIWDKPEAKDCVRLEWPAPIRAGDPYIEVTAFSPDRKLLAAGWNTGDVQVWNIESAWQKKAPEKKPLAELKGDGKSVRAVAIDGAGKRVAIGAVDGGLGVWDVASGKKLASFPRPKAPRAKGQGDSYDAQWCVAASFSADGKTAAVVDLHGLRLLDVATEKEVARLDWEKKPSLEWAAWSAAFSADGKKLAVGFANGGIKLWRLDELWQNNRPPARAEAVIWTGTENAPAGQNFPVRSLSFSPDTRLLSTMAGGVSVWEFLE